MGKLVLRKPLFYIFLVIVKIIYLNLQSKLEKTKTLTILTKEVVFEIASWFLDKMFFQKLKVDVF